MMLPDEGQNTIHDATATQKEADRKARAKHANPDVGSPEEGEVTTDDNPPGSGT